MVDKNYETILTSQDGPIIRIALNRPEVHNAFNDKMVEELLEVFSDIAERQDLRVVILTGQGKSFCAGADLNWMRRVKDYSFEENLKESKRLADLMYAIYALPLPTIARINGATIGGGTGLMAACDLVIAAQSAKISLSEVKLGLVPAVISPYVVRRAGESACRQFMLTGERLTAEKALDFGLVNQVVPMENLDEAVQEHAAQLLTSGPEALKTCKELLRRVPEMSFEEVKSYTAEVIARLRLSDEGQEGMAAFLEKRKPKWLRDE
ncbi:enoyl-CoA hydratase/isomerase family protein [Candidatus Zixiibacteriota bacterium]